jgi:hypothetical protein
MLVKGKGVSQAVAIKYAEFCCHQISAFRLPHCGGKSGVLIDTIGHDMIVIQHIIGKDYDRHPKNESRGWKSLSAGLKSDD